MGSVERTRTFRRCSVFWPLGLMLVMVLVPVRFGWAHGLHVLSETGQGVPLSKGPHEGQLRKVLNHHFELLVKEDKGILVYLYDAEMKPVSVEEKEGLLYLRFPDRTKRTVKLQPKGDTKKDSYFEAGLNVAASDSVNAVLSVKIGKRRHNLRFSYSRAEDDTSPPSSR